MRKRLLKKNAQKERIPFPARFMDAVEGVSHGKRYGYPTTGHLFPSFEQTMAHYRAERKAKLGSDDGGA